MPPPTIAVLRLRMADNDIRPVPIVDPDHSVCCQLATAARIGLDHTLSVQLLQTDGGTEWTDAPDWVNNAKTDVTTAAYPLDGRLVRLVRGGEPVRQSGADWDTMDWMHGAFNRASEDARGTDRKYAWVRKPPADAPNSITERVWEEPADSSAQWCRFDVVDVVPKWHRAMKWGSTP